VNITRLIRRAWAAGALSAVVLLLAASSASASFTPAQEAQMRQAVEHWRSTLGYPGILAGVWQDGVGSFETAVGVANRKTGRPVAVTDRFHIGSITKTFTATLALQLVRRGELRLGDRLSEYFGGVPLARRITLRELLDMTSGVPDYTNNRWLRAELARPHRNWGPAQLVRRAVRLKRPFARPGRHWDYSSTNYILLGQIIKRVTGQRLAKLFERRVFDRLGMNETTFEPRRHPGAKPLAHGYIRRSGRVVDTTDWNMSYAGAAGGASSTLGDLRRWGLALATGRGVLSERMQRKRLHPLSHGVTGRQGYGLGISVVEFPFGEFLGHDGAVLGYDAFVAYSPSSRITVAALGNTSAELKPLEHSTFDQFALAGLASEMLKPLFPG
jgi:D-alanyl-D-alanine carboxypeptidase